MGSIPSLSLSPPPSTSESDHQSAVGKHCDQLMEFQGKMSEACVKFEHAEEEHMAQMVTFMIKIARVSFVANVCVYAIDDPYHVFNHYVLIY